MDEMKLEWGWKYNNGRYISCLTLPELINSLRNHYDRSNGNGNVYIINTIIYIML